MAASLKDPGSIPGGGPKRFHDSFNFVFCIVGECISCAADTHLATDLTCKSLSLSGQEYLKESHLSVATTTTLYTLPVRATWVIYLIIYKRGLPFVL